MVYDTIQTFFHSRVLSYANRLTDFGMDVNQASNYFKKVKIDFSDYNTEVNMCILSQTSYHPWQE